MLNDNDSYFAKEKEVFNKFCEIIDENLLEGYDVYADASHLNTSSRAKLINNLEYLTKEIEVYVVFLDTSLEECIKRNNNRSGRANVPEDVIKNMYNSISIPIKKEGISGIIHIDEAGWGTFIDLEEEN